MTKKRKLYAGLRHAMEWLSNPEIIAAGVILLYLDILWLQAFYLSAAWLALANTVACNLALIAVLLWSKLKSRPMPIYILLALCVLLVLPAIDMLGVHAFMPR